MADNYAATQGAGTNFAADDVGGVLYPRLKLALGADGAADMDLDSGQQTMVNSGSWGGCRGPERRDHQWWLQ